MLHRQIHANWALVGRWEVPHEISPARLVARSLRLQGPCASHFTCENNQSGSSVCTSATTSNRRTAATGPSPSRAHLWTHEHRLRDTPDRRRFPERTHDDPALLPARKLHGVATGVQWTATPAEARGGRKGKPKAAKEQHAKEEESILDNRDVGKHMNGTPANGPPCDLNSACSVAESLGLTVPSMRTPWTGSVAVRCHPWPGMPGSMSTQLSTPSTRSQLLPRRCVEPNRCQMFFRSVDPGQVEGRVLGMEGVHDASANGWVPLMDHLQTLCPPRPESGSGEQCSAAEPKAAQTQWQAGQIPINAGRSNPEKVWLRHLWSDASWCGQLQVDESEGVVCPSATTVQKEQPSILEILNGEDLLEQLVMFLRQRRQLGTNNIWVSQWCAQNPHALVLAAQSGIAFPHNRVLVVDSGRCPQHLNVQWSHTSLFHT